MATHGKAVSLEECIVISESLDRLLSSSFGPNASHNLLSTSTGKLMITNSGRSILQSLHLSHPVGRLLVKSAVSLHNTCGDHSKSFIAIITEALHQIENHVHSQDDHQRNYKDERRATQQLAISRALTEIKLSILPLIQKQIIEDAKKQDVLLGGEKLHQQAMEICRKVLWNSLQGRFNTDTRQKLVTLVLEYLTQNCTCPEDLPCVVQNLIDKFSFICVDNPGQSVLNSRVLDGVVIQRTFPAGASPKLPLVDVHIVLVKFSLENSCPTETVSHLRLGSLQEAKSSLLLKSSHINKLIHWFNHKQVKVILSSELVSSSTALVFAQHGIYIVHSVDEEELDHLSLVTNTYVVCEDSDLTLDSVVAQVSRVDILVAASRNCILIKPVEQKPSQQKRTVLRHSILLCAPTAGTCDQYASAVLSGIKSTLLAINPSHYINVGENTEGSIPAGRNHDEAQPEPINQNRSNYSPIARLKSTGLDILVCPGGGGFEIFVHSTLKKYSAASMADHPSLALATRILSEAFLAVPLRLLKNSYIPQAKGSSVVHLYKMLNINHPTTFLPSSETELRTTFHCQGINARTGQELLGDSDIIEPLAGKIIMANYVLDVLQQILRIDQLIPVSRLPLTSNGKGSDTED